MEKLLIVVFLFLGWALTQEDFPTVFRTLNGIYLRMLNKTEILLTDQHLMETYDPDREYNDRGAFNFDYVVGLQLNNLFYPMKIDLRTSIPYLTDIACKKCNTTQEYFADFSGSAQKIAQYDTSCFGTESGTSGNIMINEE